MLPARRLAALLFASSILTQPGWAEDLVRFSVQGGAAEQVEGDLRNASALLTAVGDEKTGAEDIFAAAQAEYGALVTTLYALGYYSPVVHVLVDGREAATIPPLDAPGQVGAVVVTVDPGPKFKFSQAKVAPLAPETELPEDFAVGKTAASGLIREAVQAGIEGWRDTGHAKADVGSQDVVADHKANTLSADVRLAPGPRLRFGTLSVTGQQRMSERRILKIAGLPEGEVYSPELLKRSADRLRRTGVFKSVSLAEAEGVRAPDLLDITATVVEEKTRRYSIGAEIASFEGLDLSGYWLHRNLLGGGERLKVEAEVANIGAQSSGVDYGLGVTLDRPATLTPDTTLSFEIMLDILLIVVIGGMGTMYGAVIDAMLFVFAQNYLQDLLKVADDALQGVPLLSQLVSPDRWLLWLGVLFVLSVYHFPAGVVGRLRFGALKK